MATRKDSAAGIEWLRERLAHLQTLSASLAAARTEQEAIDATLNRGLHVFEADQAVIVTLDDATGRFRIAAMRGYPGEVGSRWATFPDSDDYPLAQAVRQQDAIIVHGPDELIRRYPKLAGTERSAVLVCLPMGDFGGISLGYDRDVSLDQAEIEFMTAVARQCGEAIRRTALDGERRRRAQRLALLAEAGAAFARTLDYRTTLAEVAKLAVPRLADCCIVDVVEATGLHQLAAVHVEPEKLTAVAELERRYPSDPDEPRSAVGEVLRSGRATLVAEVDEQFLGPLSRDEAHREGVMRLGMRSLIIAPLTARGRTLGAITLIIDSSDRRYDDQDLATARGLADRAALAIDNARLHQAQIEIATTLQRSLLPTHLPTIAGVELATRYMAAAEGVEVGGDFYDVWLLDGGFGVAMGDVSGKGAGAASMTALARHTLRVASLHEPTPSRVLRVLNGEIQRHGAPGMFCTAICLHATADPGGGLHVTIAHAGHPPALVRRRDGVTEEVGVAGTLLGVREQVMMNDTQMRLAAGDALVLYTDGVTERRDGTRMFGDQRLAELVASVPDGTDADGIALAIETAIDEFSVDPPQDDVAILVLRVAP